MRVLILLLTAFSTSLLAACGDHGVCVSSEVDVFGLGSRVYCTDDMSSDECMDYSIDQVNAAERWEHYEGETCVDLGLTPGSNRVGD